MSHPRQPLSGAFPRAEAFNRADDGFDRNARLTPQQLREMRLLLTGESVVDWHRLDFETLEQARTLLALNSLDPTNPADGARLDDLRARALRYLTETLRLRISDRISHGVPVEQLFLIAGGEGKDQRHACVLLKVMHIIYHLDARELRTRLPISDADLFGLVEESVARLFDELRASQIPVVEFSWSRKTRPSLVTKLLVKPQTRAARVFDRLRFRLIVRRPDDLGPALHVLLHRCIPFNYVVPGQTVNTLVELAPDGEGSSGQVVRRASTRVDRNPTTNESSSETFRLLNFVADLPVRVDDLIDDEECEHAAVVFVLAEFQILDEATADANDQGDSAHALYKDRQHARVRERLLRTPPSEKPGDFDDSK